MSRRVGAASPAAVSRRRVEPPRLRGPLATLYRGQTARGVRIAHVGERIRVRRHVHGVADVPDPELDAAALRRGEAAGGAVGLASRLLSRAATRSARSIRVAAAARDATRGAFSFSFSFSFPAEAATSRDFVSVS